MLLQLTILLLKIQQVLAVENKSEFKSSEFQDFIGQGKYMFHLRKYNQNLCLLQHILNNVPNTVQEREILIDLLDKIQKERSPSDDLNSREYKVIENLKTGIPTSKAYSECIASAQERFPWSTGKMWVNRFLSFFSNILLGFGLYFFDVFTDYKFSQEMFRKSETNFTQKFVQCKTNGESMLKNMYQVCENSYGSEECFEALQNSTKNYCFENQQVFDNLNEWSDAGIVTVTHIASPIIFSYIVSLVLNTSKKFGSGLLTMSFLKIPLPFLTKLQKTWIDWNKFGVFTMEREPDATEYLKSKEKWQNLESKYEKKVNNSLIIESSLGKISKKMNLFISQITLFSHTF